MTTSSRSRTGRVCVVLALSTVVACGLFAPVAEAGPKLKVMSRNLYLGTDLIPIAVSPNMGAFQQAARRGYDNVKATDFPARAKLIAREIDRRKPDIIGLQEVALWRTGPKDGVASNETTVAYDWLEILRAAIKDRGLKYRLHGLVQPEFDFSGPTAGNFEVRLTMHDAILVRKRKGLRIGKTAGANFDTNVSIPLPALDRTVEVTRGWVYANGSLKGEKFRVVNTHLEAYGDAPRLAQANELIASGGPGRARRPVILVGDINSDPNGDPDGQGDPKPYQAVTGFGFLDGWTRVHPGEAGFACCLSHKGADGLPDLLDPPPFPADHRIDHILYRGGITPLKARRVGLSRANRTAGGLWPSDHGGVVVKFDLN